jgi:hypothetical protein
VKAQHCVLHLPSETWYGPFATHTDAGIWADKKWPCGPSWVYLVSVAKKLGMTTMIDPNKEAQQ